MLSDGLLLLSDGILLLSDDILLCLQQNKLEEHFRKSKYPDIYTREELGHKLDLSEEVVKVSLTVVMRGGWAVFHGL